MHDPATTVGLTGLTLLALVATVLALVRLRRPRGADALRTTQYALTGACIVGAAALFAYRTIFITVAGHPFGAHVDGLLLMAAAFGAAVLFVQRAGIPGLTAFALPPFTVLLAWGICASAWTYEPYPIGSLWLRAHEVSVYLGALVCLIAGAAGVMYLYAQRRLRRRLNPAATESMASLEAIEQLNVRTATIGFTLLSLALLTGLVITTEPGGSRMGSGWWHSPKVVVAAAAWLVYALVMNIRYATAFRGARAAWLSIAGVVLLIVTFVIVQRMPGPTMTPGAAADGPSPPAAAPTPEGTGAAR